jgi:hypothetical protein
MKQYSDPIGPRLLTPFARLMQLVGLLSEQATRTEPEHRHATPALRARRKRERQDRRRGRLAQRGRR